MKKYPIKRADFYWELRKYGTVQDPTDNERQLDIFYWKKAWWFGDYYGSSWEAGYTKQAALDEAWNYYKSYFEDDVLEEEGDEDE